MHLMTLVINFYCPLLKEVLLLHGICNCSIEACRNILSKYALQFFLAMWPLL
jgi:hypothetical protein